MASLGHIAIGMAAASVADEGRTARWSAMAWWAGLSLLPDADVVGFALGVQYGDPWGHRGATHSLALSAGLGLAIGFAVRGFGRLSRRTAGLAVAVLASHALLDTMTDGGLGCALFWPFDLTRYFAPWRPIPVAPIGLGMLSIYGVMVVLAELAIFAPVFLFALRSPALATRHVVSLMALWLAAFSIVESSPRTRDGIAGSLFRDRTSYTAGFSEAAFRGIAPGQSESEVRRRLGAPFGESWIYATDSRPPDERPLPAEHACLLVAFEGGAVARVYDAGACRARGVTVGLSNREVERVLGAPPESCWQYSRGNGRPFRQRGVCFSNGGVRWIVAR